MDLQQENRELWLWLRANEGAYTAREVAKAVKQDTPKVFRKLSDMSRRQLLSKFPPNDGERAYRYGVTGLCLVPLGLTVAEVQA